MCRRFCGGQQKTLAKTSCVVRANLRWILAALTVTLHGCSTSLGYETVGVDVSAWGTKQAKSILGSEFLVCDVQTPLPFEADKFDLVTCFDVLEHLPNPEKALSNMFDVCKGALVCTTPNKKVEKPIRKLMRDYDETHISVKSPADWQ